MLVLDLQNVAFIDFYCWNYSVNTYHLLCTDKVSYPSFSRCVKKKIALKFEWKFCSVFFWKSILENIWDKILKLKFVFAIITFHRNMKQIQNSHGKIYFYRAEIQVKASILERPSSQWSFASNWLNYIILINLLFLISFQKTYFFSHVTSRSTKGNIRIYTDIRV